ncbi:MAG: hypothetical protein IJF50_11010, partial [Peptococcaceae bacterium]|nr:hypothetical protein [Peptococcaceae bacterium]
MTAKYAKRYAALMIILVLLLFCQCTALAEEENSTTVPEIELDYDTLSFEVYHQGYIPYHYCNFEIENAYELNSFYGGEACWELINIEGDAATLS